MDDTQKVPGTEGEMVKNPEMTEEEKKKAAEGAAPEAQAQA